MSLEVTWIQTAPRQPLCDVPWVGNSVVLADGSVNFCCFSSAVVGNVNELPFDKIWNGKSMQRIRRALSNQSLPAECRSTSCPIYRGDDMHNIIDRMEGPSGPKKTGTQDPHKEIRERLKGSELKISPPGEKGGTPAISVNLRIEGGSLSADLFVAMTLPNGTTVFLPGEEDYALPFQTWLTLKPEEPRDIQVLAPERKLDLSGEYQVCAALFHCSQNPNLLSNCYWSAVGNFTV